MKSTATRTISLIIGGLAVLVGAIWIGQGAGLIKGSFMTGSRTWLAIGLLCLVVGLLLLFLALRRTSQRRCLRARRGSVLKLRRSPLGVVGHLLDRPAVAVGIAEEDE